MSILEPQTGTSATSSLRSTQRQERPNTRADWMQSRVLVLERNPLSNLQLWRPKGNFSFYVVRIFSLSTPYFSSWCRGYQVMEDLPFNAYIWFFWIYCRWGFYDLPVDYAESCVDDFWGEGCHDIFSCSAWRICLWGYAGEEENDFALWADGQTHTR
jgi:hypothetical protein